VSIKLGTHIEKVAAAICKDPQANQLQMAVPLERLEKCEPQEYRLTPERGKLGAYTPKSPALSSFSTEF
jgi:hypothetical protein